MENICQQLWKHLLGNKNVIVLTHEFPDPDACTSCAVMCELLNSYGVNATTLVSPEGLASQKHFDNKYVQEFNGSLPVFDTILILDCSDYSRVGSEIFKLIEQYQEKTIIIDHHEPVNNKPLFKLADSHAPSTSKLIWDLIEYNKLKYSNQIITLIHGGIMGDTGFLRFPSATPDILRLVASMRELGVDLDWSYEKIVHNNTLIKISLLGTILTRVKQSNKVPYLAYSYATHEETTTYQNEIEQLDTSVGGTITSMQRIELSVFLKCKDNNQVKMSFRGNGKVNCTMIAKNFGGGGHFSAAGAGGFTGTLEEAIEAIEQFCLSSKTVLAL